MTAVLNLREAKVYSLLHFQRVNILIVFKELI